ncbi:hypothetical protein M3701_05080 [Corynebacterium mucifaciens]|nr:hypothetical protein [Corynebacterium mucifaciens]
MSAVRVNIQPHMLAWALDSTGLPEAELEKRFPKLPQWRSGENRPTLPQARELAKLARIPLGRLLLDEPTGERSQASDPELMARAYEYTYETVWSSEDGEFVSIVVEFPSLSSIDADPEVSLANLQKLVAQVIVDMEANGEGVPNPIAPERTQAMIDFASDVVEAARVEARRRGISLSEFVEIALRSALY